MLVVGSIHMDFAVVLDRFPRVGETVIGSGFKMSPGGKGANQAVAAARLGAETYMVGRVGNDAIGMQLLENLRANQVKTEYVLADPESYTGVALIFVDREGRNMIAVAPGTDARVSPSDVDRAFSSLGRPDAVLLQLEIPVETVVHAARRGREAGSLIVLSPAPYRPLPRELFKCVDVLVPNEVEAEQMTGVRVEGEEGCKAAGTALLDMGVGSVVITLGSRGAYVVSQEFTGLVEAFRVNAVDTTGAGDAFSAALAVALAEGRGLREAVVFANAVAAIKVTRLGAQEGMPVRAEVEKFLEERGVKLG